MKLASTPIKIREIMAARRAPLKVFKKQRSTRRITIWNWVTVPISKLPDSRLKASTADEWISSRDAITSVSTVEEHGSRVYTITTRPASSPVEEIKLSYHSVTTILGRMLDKTSIEEWRDAVGHEQADAYTAAASEKGSNVHAMIECYVRLGHNSSDQINHANFSKVMASDGRTPEEFTIFHLLRQHIDTFDNFEGVEVLIYHPRHKYAGRIDLIGRRGDKLVLIDIKTYGKQRSDEHLLSAKLQTTLYAIAMRDVYGVHIDEVEIVYANPTSGLQVVPVDVASYESEAIELTTKYEMLYA